MPDITKCSNTNCLLRAECYRFTSEPDPLHQPYAEFKPAIDDGVQFECDAFWIITSS